MRRWRSILCGYMVAAAATAVAQSYITPVRADLTPPTPQSSRPVEYQMPQPAMLTGAVDLSIPIYNIVAGDISLPITLQYRTNGIKVLDDPCPYGYGWSLMPAMRATRTILGRPDEHFPFYKPYYYDDMMAFCYKCMVKPSVHSVEYPGHYDSQHDIIHIALPDYTVVRVMDFTNGKAEFAGGCDTEYRVEADSKLDTITVTDASGTKYIFSSPYEYEANDIATPGTLRTAWALKEIQALSGDRITMKWSINDHPRANRQIYSSEHFMDKFNMYEWAYSGIDLDSFDSSGYQDAIFERIGACHEFIKLDRIDFPGGQMQLDYTRYRTGNMLSEIKIISTTGNVVKSVKISYDSFGARTESINLSDEGTYMMEYAEGSKADPDVNSQDWWGFYNGIRNQGLVPSIKLKRYRLQQNTAGTYYRCGTADRSVDAIAMENNILKKITYPTGGYSRFEYEPHSFTPRREKEGEDEIHPDFNPYLSEGGGLRVKLIETSPAKGSEQVQTVRYEYSPAVVREVPSMATFVDVHPSVIPLVGVDYSTGTIDYVRSVDIRPLSDCMRYDFGETPIWYESVKAVYDEGCIIYRHKDIIPQSNQIYKKYGSRAHGTIYKLHSRGPQLVAKETYAEDEDGSMRMVAKDSMHYEIAHGTNKESTYISREWILLSSWADSAPDFEDVRNVSRLVNFYTDIVTIDRDPYEAYIYSIVPQSERLTRSEHTEYTPTGAHTTVKEFTYENGKTLLREISTGTSKGGKRTTRLEYPSAAAGGVQAQMAESGAHGLPVAETVTCGSATVRTEVEYSCTDSGAFRVAAMPVVFGAGTDTLASARHSYSAAGRLTGTTDPDGRSTAWQWDKDEIHPVCKMSGATPADSSAAITTRYSYYPLIGLQQTTEPWGTRTRYFYDPQNRLSKIYRNNSDYTHTFSYRIDHSLENSVTTTEYLGGGRTHQTAVYYDGLGRTVRSCDMTTGIESLKEYDSMGRVVRESVPGTGAPDRYAWTLRSYEPSPRAIAASHTKAGKLWHTQGKSVRTRRLVNTTSGEHMCLRYEIKPTCITPRGIYAPGALLVEETEDEDGHITRTYTDKDGRVVMTSEGRGDDMLRTRYLYDDYGHLRYVFPPNMDDGLYATSDKELLEKAFVYDYDSCGRLLAARTPGCAPSLTRYSRGGRVIAGHPAGMESGKWLVAFYDRHGRSVLSAIVTATEAQIESYGAALPTAAYTGCDSTLCGYSFDRELPFTDISVQEALYFDNYDFTKHLPGKYSGTYLRDTQSKSPVDAPRGLETGRHDCLTNEISAVYYDAAGFVAERRELHTGGQRSVTYSRDIAGNLLRSAESYVRSDGKSYTRTTDYSYDAAGRMTACSVNENGATADITYGYDNSGRRSWEQCGNGVRREFDYDLNGWLTETRTDVPATDRLIGGIKLRGDTFGISKLYYGNIDGTQKKVSGEKSDITAHRLSYSDRLLYAEGAQPRYTGCPSGRKTTLGGRYDYFYDAHDRLTEARYKPPSTSLSCEDFSTAYSYDPAGNVLAARRYGIVDTEENGGETFGVLDDLAYSYDGNRVTSIENQHDGTDFYGRTGYPAGEGLYEWDDAGRMTADSSRGILSANYDYRNLPTQTVLDNGNSETNLYDAAGLLRATHISREKGLLMLRTYTADRVFYGTPFSQSLQYSYFTGGYFDGNGAVHYMHTDYQGSVVMVTDSTGAIEQHISYYPYGEPHRNPAGQPILYAGKERMSSTDDYNFDARRYHAPAMFMSTPDPSASSFHALSPYSYCGANPIKYIDLTGRKFTDSSNPFIDLLTDAAESTILDIEKRIQINTNKISRLNTTSKKRAKLEKKNNKLNNKKKHYQQVLDELEILKNSNLTYDISLSNKQNKKNGNETEYISYSLYFHKHNIFYVILGIADSGSVAHELKHAYQFETGTISFDTRNKPKCLLTFYDITDEIEAYNRGALFGQKNRIHDIPFYKTLPKKALDASFLINSSDEERLFFAQLNQCSFRIGGKTYTQSGIK